MVTDGSVGTVMSIARGSRDHCMTSQLLYSTVGGLATQKDSAKGILWGLLQLQICINFVTVYCLRPIITISLEKVSQNFVGKHLNN